MSDPPTIHDSDAIAAGITEVELAEMKDFLIKTFPSKSESGILEVYMGHSVSWSDECKHVTAHDKTVLEEPHKCHLSGVTYKMTNSAKLSSFMNSDEIGAAISVYEIVNFGDIDELLDNPDERHKGWSEVVKHYQEHTTEMRDLLRNSVYEHHTDNGGAAILKGHEILLGPRAPKYTPTSDGNTVPIGSRAGFVSLAWHGGMDKRKVYLIVKSYDTKESRLFFEAIHSTPDMTVKDLLENTTLTGMAKQAKDYGNYNRGVIAYDIIHRILGWRTSKKPTKVLYRQMVSYVESNHTFGYYSMDRNDDGKLLFRDHMYKVDELKEYKHWLMMAGRDVGFYLYALPKTLGEWDRKRLDSLAMGVRKIRSTGSVKRGDIQPIKSASGGDVYTFSQGIGHPKMIPGKYLDPKTFGATVMRSLGLPDEASKPIECRLFFNSSGYRFNSHTRDNLPLRVKLAMLPGNVPFHVHTSDAFVTDHMLKAFNMVRADNNIEGQDSQKYFFNGFDEKTGLWRLNRSAVEIYVTEANI